MFQFLVVAATLLPCIHAAELRAESSARPNIVYIMADDLGIGDVKCFGGDRCQIATPNFDRLAREGMKFTDAHAIASVCVPSRMAIMTGRYPWRFRRTRPSGPWGFLNPRLPKGQHTLATMLGGAGYRTGYVGKWHLGTLMATRDGKNQDIGNVDYSKPLLIGPPQFGFDESFILPGSLDMYPYVFARNNRWVGTVDKKRGWSAFNRVGPTENSFEDYKVLDTFCREAEKFIGTSAKGKKPFFLYLALTAPHTPVSPHPGFRGRSRLGPYGDFVMETDDCVGRVMAALEKHNLTGNTLVIATSDHGAAPYAGPRLKATAGQVRKMEAVGHFPSGIYRGYKFSAYEGGLRIPFVARWPGHVPAGTSCDSLIGLNDLMATLAEITNTKLSAGKAPDSISYLQLLKTPQSEGRRKTLVMQSTMNFVVRQGPWKLALCPGSGCRGHLGNIPTARQAWQEALKSSPQPGQGAQLLRAPFVQLFHLGNDPTESKNLAKGQPERVKQLANHIGQVVRRGRSTPGPSLNNDVPGVNYLPRPIR